jgi:hypothetical protein
MQAAWRLATSSLSARRSRAALLVAAVTLSAALIARWRARSLGERGDPAAARITDRLGGAADPPGERGGRVPDRRDRDRGVVARDGLRGAPGAGRDQRAGAADGAGASSRMDRRGRSWVRTERTLTTDAMANGVDLETEFEIRPPTMIAGRLPRARGEIAVGAKLAERLSWVVLAGERDRGGAQRARGGHGVPRRARAGDPGGRRFGRRRRWR